MVKTKSAAEGCEGSSRCDVSGSASMLEPCSLPSQHCSAVSVKHVCTQEKDDRLIHRTADGMAMQQGIGARSYSQLQNTSLALQAGADHVSTELNMQHR